MTKPRQAVPRGYFATAFLRLLQLLDAAFGAAVIAAGLGFSSLMAFELPGDDGPSIFARIVLTTLVVALPMWLGLWILRLVTRADEFFAITDSAPTDGGGLGDSLEYAVEKIAGLIATVWAIGSLSHFLKIYPAEGFGHGNALVFVLMIVIPGILAKNLLWLHGLGALTRGVEADLKKAAGFGGFGLSLWFTSRMHSEGLCSHDAVNALFSTTFLALLPAAVGFAFWTDEGVGKEPSLAGEGFVYVVSAVVSAACGLFGLAVLFEKTGAVVHGALAARLASDLWIVWRRRARGLDPMPAPTWAVAAQKSPYAADRVFAAALRIMREVFLGLALGALIDTLLAARAARFAGGGGKAGGAGAGGNF